MADPVLFLGIEADTIPLYFAVEAVLFISCSMVGRVDLPLILHQLAEASGLRHAYGYV